MHLTRASKYILQKLIELKGELDKSTITVGDFNTPLSITDRTNRQKISKDREDLNNTINQFDLTGVDRTPIQQQQDTYSLQVHMELSPR